MERVSDIFFILISFQEKYLCSLKIEVSPVVLHIITLHSSNYWLRYLWSIFMLDNIKININANLWIFQFSTVNCFHGFHNYFHSIDLRKKIFIYYENWGQPGRFAYNQFPQLYFYTSIQTILGESIISGIRVDIHYSLVFPDLLCFQTFPTEYPCVFVAYKQMSSDNRIMWITATHTYLHYLECFSHS